MVINHIICKSKVFADLCFTKQKIKTKNGFVEVVYSVLVEKVCWKNILKIVVKQSVNLEEGLIEFESYFNQIPVPFKIYAEFGCNLRGVESY